MNGTPFSIRTHGNHDTPSVRRETKPDGIVVGRGHGLIGARNQGNVLPRLPERLWIDCRAESLYLVCNFFRQSFHVLLDHGQAETRALQTVGSLNLRIRLEIGPTPRYVRGCAVVSWFHSRQG